MKFIVTLRGLQRLGASIVFPLSSLAHANSEYYRHVIFDNSLTGDNYFYSGGGTSGGSFLET